jgi:hypothetical protein
MTRSWRRSAGERIGQLRTYEREEIQRINEARDEELRELLKGNTVALMLKKGTVEPLHEEGTKLSVKLLEEIDFNEVDMTTLKVQNKAASERIRRLIDAAKERSREGPGEDRGADRQGLPARRAVAGRGPAGEGLPGREAQDQRG